MLKKLMKIWKMEVLKINHTIQTNKMEQNLIINLKFRKNQKIELLYEQVKSMMRGKI